MASYWLFTPSEAITFLRAFHFEAVYVVKRGLESICEQATAQVEKKTKKEIIHTNSSGVFGCQVFSINVLFCVKNSGFQEQKQINTVSSPYHNRAHSKKTTRTFEKIENKSRLVTTTYTILSTFVRTHTFDHTLRTQFISIVRDGRKIPLPMHRLYIMLSRNGMLNRRYISITVSMANRDLGRIGGGRKVLCLINKKKHQRTHARETIARAR